MLLSLVGCHAVRFAAPPARLDDLPWGDAVADRMALSARDQAERGNPRAALTQLDALLASQPGHVDARRLRQDVLRERGRRGLLTHEAEQALAADPGSAAAHYLYGRIALDRDRKLHAFARAAELAPASIWPWLGLAHTLRDRDPERAGELYARLFAASGGHPLVGVAYAAVLREQQRLPEAEAVYRRLQGDPRIAGVGDLGLAQVALARDDRGAAWGALLRAWRQRPFDAGVQALVHGWLEAGARDDQVAQLVDALREAPQRFAALARSGVPLATALLQRSGQLQAARSALDARQPTARQPVLRRQQRRLALALGDVAAFLEIVRADVPLHVVDHEPNQVRGRWLSLVRGPWHAGEPLATPAQTVALLEALRAVGWLHEAELLASVAERRWPAAAVAIAMVRDEVRTEIAFEAGVRRLLYQGYQTGDASVLPVVIERLRELSLRVLGRDVVGRPTIFSAPLVGEMVDPFSGELAAHFDRYNKHFVLGRRAGGTAEGLLLARLSLAELPAVAELALPARCFEVVGIDRDVRSLAGVLGGDLAGVALLNHFLVDFDAVREWAHGIAERRRVAAEDGGALAQDPLPRPDEHDPFDAAWRLALQSPVADTELDAAVLDTIRHHERQHLVDSYRYLPVENNLWRSLGLLLEFAFSPSAIEAEMERRAELASLALSPHTELVLAHIADFLGDGSVRSPHHQGFSALARELCGALRELGVPADDATPGRWHRVPRALVQAAARRLLEQLP